MFVLRHKAAHELAFWPKSRITDARGCLFFLFFLAVLMEIFSGWGHGLVLVFTLELLLFSLGGFPFFGSERLIYYKAYMHSYMHITWHSMVFLICGQTTYPMSLGHGGHQCILQFVSSAVYVWWRYKSSYPSAIVVIVRQNMSPLHLRTKLY